MINSIRKIITDNYRKLRYIFYKIDYKIFILQGKMSSIDDLVCIKISNICCELTQNMKTFLEQLKNNGIRITVEKSGKYDMRSKINEERNKYLIDILKQKKDIIEVSFNIIDNYETFFFNYRNKN